jgi:hypothetical protein
MLYQQIHVEEFIYRYATTPPVEIAKSFLLIILAYSFSKELRVLPEDDR